jgi:hypothetical protein
MNAAYTTYTVTFEILGSDPDTREFENLYDAHKAYNEIDLAYEFCKIHRTAGWRATEDMTLAKSLDARYYDEDDNELDNIEEPLRYEEYGIEDYRADED